MYFNYTMILHLLVMVGLCNGHNHPENVYLDYPGDIKLGALFPIHKKGEEDGKACGAIQKEDGIQPLEAMLYTLDEINQSDKLLPGIKLGTTAFDSCDNPIHATEKAIPLLKGFMTRKVHLSCNETIYETLRVKRNHHLSNDDWPCGDNIVGIIGPQTSAVSVQLANIGRLFRVPQVSYLATSNRLCNLKDFPYFFRTVPSDVHQAKAIVELLNTFDWNYVTIVHSDSDYGETGYQSIKRRVEETKKICLAEPITIYNTHFKHADYVKIIHQLIGGDDKIIKPKVVIVFADRQPAGKLIEAAKSLGVKDRFIWVGSDAWASRESVVEDREEFVEGAIAIQPLRRKLPGYNEYFRNLIKEPNMRNPWFNEYLLEYHNCSNRATEGFLPCNLSTETAKYSQQLYIHFVRDAVHAFAHALHNLHEDSCLDFDQHRLCLKFKKRVFTDLHTYLRHVEFMDVDKKPFHFSGIGMHDGPPRYSIINFQKVNTNLKYDWKNVGTYHEGDISDIDQDFWKLYDNATYLRQCERQECDASQVKVPDTNDQCCWHCINCEVHEYKVSDFECKPCKPGQWSQGPEGNNRSICYDMPVTYLDYSSSWSIASMCVACLGIIMTVTAMVIFWMNWNTPVVKASGRELSSILLLGVLLSFMTTFVIVAKPCVIVCGLMRFAIGFCYTVCYATVVTKTNRVARIFQQTSTHPRFISPLSSTLIVLALISIEIFINIIWLLVEPPDIAHIIMVPPGKKVLVCSGLDTTIMAGLIYPFFLIVLATLYAFKTRKCPGGFNETKFIFFANTVTTIHWFAYVPLYLASTDNDIRAVILAFSLSLSGIVQLCCLIMPKLYTVVFKPQRNTRNAVMTSHHQSHSRFQLPETPPHSVAVGMADGAAVLSRVYGKDGPPLALELGLSSNTIEATALATDNFLSTSYQEGKLCQSDERPRSRSFSVSRSTQTNIKHPKSSKQISFSMDRKTQPPKIRMSIRTDSEDVNEICTMET